jgi:hypothetical protein
MILESVFSNPALGRAIVLGLFGGVGLALTTITSRRGPMIFPVYAAILVGLAMLLSRFSDITHAEGLIATLAGFSVASGVLYVATMLHARRILERDVARGRLPASALDLRISVLGHAWRIAALLVIGTVVSAGVAFVAI